MVLRLRFDDFTRVTRSHTLPRATAHTPTILRTARWLLDGARPLIDRQGLTLIGMAVANLESDPPCQQLLPLERIRAEQLDAVLDALCERYGSKAVTRAVLVNQRGRDVLPILPD